MEILALVLFVVACQAIGLLGSIPTFKAIPTWYVKLRRPSWNPPNKVFAPVWTTLYLLMAIAAWRCWGVRKHSFDEWLLPFSVQLALNLAWPWIFFGAKEIGMAMIEMVALWVSIVWCLFVLWRIDPISGVLFVPYLLWVTYAFSLNAGIWVLNRDRV